MTSNVDAVIAALKVALAEAEGSRATFWGSREANRWINQLPGAWFGRWWHLKLRGDMERQVLREEFIRHVRATLAYLEADRNQLAGGSWFNRRAPHQDASLRAEPMDAEFQDVSPNVHALTDAPAKKRNR